METRETFTQWNVQGMSSSKKDLINIVDIYKPVVIAVRETFYGGDFVAGIWGYNAICKQGHFNHRFHGWVAMRNNDTMPICEIFINTHLQVDAPRVNISEYKTVTCVSAHVHGRVDFGNDLKMIMQGLPKPIIFMGDLKPHHTNWVNKNINRRGLQLQDICASLKLNIMNGDIPTHVSGTSIDMTIVSADLPPAITWMVGPSVLSNDHFPVVVLFNMMPQTAADCCEEGWNYKEGK